MSKNDVFEIITKMFGIYCIVQFIRSTPAVISAIVVNHPEAFIPNKPLYIFFMSLYPLIFLLLSVLFIWKSETIAKYFCANSSSNELPEDQAQNEKASYAKLSFWIVIIGFYYLISSTAAVLAGLPSIAMKLDQGWFFTHDPFLPQSLIFVMSLICVLRSEKIEKIIIQLQKRNLIGIGLPITEEPSHTTWHTDHVPRRFG